MQNQTCFYVEAPEPASCGSQPSLFDRRFMRVWAIQTLSDLSAIDRFEGAIYETVWASSFGKESMRRLALASIAGIPCALTCAVSTMRAVMGLVVVILVLGCQSGCQYWTNKAVNDYYFPNQPEASPTTEKRAIDLEVFFVDRVKDSPLIGENLWQSLHQVSTISVQNRTHLDKHGFRIAFSPARPSRQLQSLMALSTNDDPTRRALKQSLTLPVGQETFLLASTIPEGTKVRLDEDGVEHVLDIVDGKSMFRLKAELADGGWAKITLIPELRHGQHSLRPQGTKDEFVFRHGQKPITFYEDRITAEINIGEILVLGSDPQREDALASHFFCGDGVSGPSNDIERLMLIRVADVRDVRGQRMEQR